MSKKTMIIAGVVAVAAVAIIVALSLMSGEEPAPTASGSTGAGSTTGTSTATSGTTPTSTASSGTTTAGTTPSKPTTSTATGGSGSSALKPFPRVPESKLPAKKVSSPVAQATDLTPLAEAPSGTISALKLGLVPEGSQYFIRMSPYGFGPPSSLGSRVAIQVNEVTPLGDAPANKSIANASLLVVMDTTRGGAVTKGGTYTAILAFRSDGTKLIPIIRGVKNAD